MTSKTPSDVSVSDVRKFDPLTSEPTGPKWLRSLEAQRKLLASKGLREIVSPNGWSSYVRILPHVNEPTLCRHGIDLRGDRRDFVDQVNFCETCRLEGDFKPDPQLGGSA